MSDRGRGMKPSEQVYLKYGDEMHRLLLEVNSRLSDDDDEQRKLRDKIGELSRKMEREYQQGVWGF